MWRIDCLLPHTEAQGECVQKHTCDADVTFCNAWNSSFLLLSLFPIFAALTRYFSAISCQSSRVGGFLTALSLGFILLMKFEFLLSFIFSLQSLLLFQTHQKCRQTCRHHFPSLRHSQHQVFRDKLSFRQWKWTYIYFEILILTQWNRSWSRLHNTLGKCRPRGEVVGSGK